MKFSERKGLVQVRNIIQTNSISDPLRNSLWNVLWRNWFSYPGFLEWRRNVKPEIYSFAEYLYDELYKLPIDRISTTDPKKLFEDIRKSFMASEWNVIYDFIEVALNYERLGNAKLALQGMVNDVLQNELAGYRMISGRFIDVTDEQEVHSLEEALNDDTYLGVKSHLQTALEHLSRRENPDFRNSIKESISAVEAMARIVTKIPKATLGDALKSLEVSKKLHPALKEGFSKLYGYTSDEDGIRHAMLEEPDLTAGDAKYMLLACTSFINYLKTMV